MSSLNHIITKTDLIKLLESSDPPILIDVREPDEVAGGMIPSAKNVPGISILHLTHLSQSARECVQFVRLCLS